MEKYRLEWQLKEVKSQVNKFKIEEETRTDKFVLIKARIECPMYFAFYGHFIVCSGDYGEWVFDCTWETAKNGKIDLTTSLHYLLGKLSKNCNKYEFDYDCAMSDVKKWERDFFEFYDEEDIKDDKKEIKEAIDDLKSSIEENIVFSAVDKFRDTMKDLGYPLDDDYSLYGAGNIIDWQLVVNLGCLLKIAEMEHLKEK